jgi:DNA modification methylase
MTLSHIIDAIGIEPYHEEPAGVIYNCDCLDVLPQIPEKSIDLVVTDPPYGIKMDKGFEGFEGFGGFGKPIYRRRYDDDWDCSRPPKEVFNHIIRTCRLALIFGGNYFADLLPLGHHWIAWDKLNTMPTFGDCELLWTNAKRKSVSKITCEYNGLLGKEESRNHPTQKPIKLLRDLIDRYDKEGGLICDPFLGSGTTAVAAKQLGRKFIGIEIEEKYCEIAAKRLAQEELFNVAI